jgi:chromosome segregation ATPase
VEFVGAIVSFEILVGNGVSGVIVGDNVVAESVGDTVGTKGRTIASFLELDKIRVSEAELGRKNLLAVK